MSTDHVLELRAVTKTFSGVTPVRALDNVSFGVSSGELVAITGPSGSGKSTLMNVIGTLDRPTSGDVLIDGMATTELADDELTGLRAARVGFVFQQFHLLEGVDVVSNVAAGMLYRGAPKADRRARAENALERVGLGHRLKHRPPQLSGGERQRVAIARAIAGDPAIVLADEPTGNLDSRSSSAIVELLYRLHGEGSTIVMITHDQTIAEEFDRRVVMQDGAINSDTAGLGAAR
jgi:putative ABC transport system ATP-binding protein